MKAEAMPEEYNATLESATELLLKFSIPLYVHGIQSRPELLGTGFFVRSGNDVFLVSAAHVLDTAKTQKVFLYYTPEAIRYLSGSMTRSRSRSNRDDDLVDVGVVRLSGGHLPPYPLADKYAMDISYLRPRHRPRTDKSYVFIGFPGTKCRVDSVGKCVTVIPYAYRSHSLPESEYISHGLDPNDHVALPLDLKRGFDIAGKHQHFPKPNGMSGSPIIVLYSEKAEDEGDVFPVVGVATTYRKGGNVVFGTDVSLVLEAIDHAM